MYCQMSGTYYSILRKRSLSMLHLAKELLAKNEADLAALNAEYAAQLYIKSVLYRVSGEEWRGHSIRVLLGALSMILEQQGFYEESDEIVEFVKRNRRLLAELEEAHTRAIYGALEYSIDQARILVDAAEKIISLLQDLEEKIFAGKTD